MRIGSQTIKLTTRPTFTQGRDIELTQVFGRDTAFLVVRAIPADLAFDDAEPPRAERFTLPAIDTTAVFEAVNAILLGPLTSEMIGCDGTVTELSVSSGQLAWNIRWWGEVPAQWSCVAQVVEQMFMLATPEGRPGAIPVAPRRVLPRNTPRATG